MPTAAIALQVAALAVLWAVFLVLQLEKSKHGNCTLPFVLIVGVQVVLLAAVTTAFVVWEVNLSHHTLILILNTACLHRS